MTLNWRSLLDDLGVEWIDRGKNTSSGNINIACPFCEDDPSFHLSISERKDAYYCYRNPNKHSGSSLVRLLTRLGVSYDDILDFRETYASDGTFEAKPTKPVSELAKRWQSFSSAVEHPKYLDYLRSRGFPTPVATCRQYDLRYAPVGTWAQRILLPVRHEGQVINWAGRAIDDALSPKYLMESSAKQSVYLPRMPRAHMVILEGPFDALKLAVATENLPIAPIGLLGKGISVQKIAQIAELLNGAVSGHVCMDANVPISEVRDLINELRAQCGCPVHRLALPDGTKNDVGELPLEEIPIWLEREAVTRPNSH